MKMLEYPNSFFKTNIEIKVLEEDLNEDGSHDFVDKFTTKCCFNFVMLQKKIDINIEEKEYNAIAVLKVNNNPKLQELINKCGPIFVGSVNVMNMDYNIIKTIPHIDFNCNIVYISLYLK